MASISLTSDYERFSQADMTTKKQIIIENILKSLKVIKMKLKNKFDYERMEDDIKKLLDGLL